MSDVVRTYRLTKAFKNKIVVSGVDMRIRQGEIYGFLGPNGAGKTTVMRMIAGLIRPTDGIVERFGSQVTPSSRETLKRMGYVIEYPMFYEHLSARDNLVLHAEYMGFYDPRAIDEALELLRLGDAGAKRVGLFSLGMKQRLGIARAICTRPELLVLDEPVNGLDPIGIHELRELFRRLSREYGMTLLVSSHILQEIEQIADTIGLIHRGRLIEEVSMARIRGRHSEYIEAATTDGAQAAFVLEDKFGAVRFKMIGDHTLRIYEPELSTVALSREWVLAGVGVESLTRRNASLEEYVLARIREEDADD
ncbi:MAG: ABC transporter ATP-binding protein [Paenibacillaceae bacterium]|nr:ABC transporter ATP-binding protein [Paenibacillaceae bacterium]